MNSIQFFQFENELVIIPSNKNLTEFSVNDIEDDENISSKRSLNQSTLNSSFLKSSFVEIKLY